MKMNTNFSSSTNLIVIVVLVMSSNMVSGQITTACTKSFMSSFTPCLNFIKGSTNGGGSPTKECCDALASVIRSSSECMCLIVTGNVPFNIPLISSFLAITLPSMCNSESVPLQCKASASPLPSPGSVAYASGLPPLPPFAGTAETNSVSPAQSPSLSELPTSQPAASADSPLNQGQRPLLFLPNLATKTSVFSSTILLPVLLLGIILQNKI